MLGRLLLVSIAFEGASAEPQAAPVSNAHLQQIHDIEKTIEANINRQLEKNTHALRRHFSAAFRARFRRLQNAATDPAQCSWDQGGCSISEAAGQTLVEKLPYGSKVSALWNKCQPCVSKKGPHECFVASEHCKWTSNSECDCEVTDEEMSEILFIEEECGWYSSIMRAMTTCGSLTPSSCATNSICEVSAEFEVPKGSVADGMACENVTKCAPGEVVTWQAICPGFRSSDALTMGCPAYSMIEMVDCVKGRCQNYGNLLEQIFSCRSYTSAQSCGDAGLGCMWDGLTCNFDTTREMMSWIPDSCAMKSAFAEDPCSGIVEESACTSESCTWRVSEDCTDDDSDTPGRVEFKPECTRDDGKLYEALAAASCKPDLAVFAQLYKTDEVCKAATSERTCKAVQPQTIDLGTCPGPDEEASRAPAKKQTKRKEKKTRKNKRTTRKKRNSKRRNAKKGKRKS